MKNIVAIFFTLCLFALWWFLSTSGYIGKTLIASPAEVAGRIWQTFDASESKSSNLFLHLWSTIKTSLTGWGYACLLGGVGGIILSRSNLLFSGVNPSLEFIRSIPPILAFPVLLVAFNFGQASYISTIVFGCVPIMTLSVARGLRAIEKERFEVFALTQRNFAWQMVVRLMEMVPSLFFGARVTFAFALIIAVVTEMVFTPKSGFGIGSIANESGIAYDTPTFYASILLIGVFGFIGNKVLETMEHRLGN